MIDIFQNIIMTGGQKMFFKEEGNSKKDQTKIRNLITLVGIFAAIFLFVKIKLFPFEFGSILLILMYIFINFNMTNFFFSSKRTTFKIYIFILLDIIYFLLGVFNMKAIFFFILFLIMLSYLVMKDEGKLEAPKIANFMILYIILKIIFTIFLIML